MRPGSAFDGAVEDDDGEAAIEGVMLASLSGGRTRAEARSLPGGGDTFEGDRATRGRPAAFAEPPRRYRLEQHSPVPSRTVPFANAPSGGHGFLDFGLDFPATAVAFRQ
jgi:hypothetical protein